MNRRNMLSYVVAIPVAASLLLAGCNNGAKTAGGDAGAGGSKKIVIAWAKWEPADNLQKLAADYTKETGTEVEVQQIPWSDFETKINSAWSGQDSSFDMVVGDSQWLGKGATNGHYVDLTEWSKTEIPVADIEPAALKNYGEYDGKLYAVPCMADGIGFSYRKDLFEDAAEKAAFKAKYGKELAIPETWEDFQKIAEFFTRPDKNLYGTALFYSKEVDGATMGFDQILWAFGGNLSDNGPAAVKALDFWIGLKKFCPPGAETFYFSESLTAFQEGKVATAMNWFAFMPGLVKPEQNKFADKTGYFVVPKGPAGRFISLGGQGLSVSAYSKNQEDAKKFAAWFSKEDTQKKWVALGGLTANKKVSATDEFKKANPYNETFSTSVQYLKDFYNTPEYTELLKTSQDELSAAITGAKTSKAALDAIAEGHAKVIKK